VSTPRFVGGVAGNGSRFVFDYSGPDTAIAINRLLRAGAHVAFDGPSRVAVTGVERESIEQIAQDTGISVNVPAPSALRSAGSLAVRAPRVAVYAPWTGGNADEGWTRWVLEQYDFSVTTVHNADITGAAGVDLRARLDAIVLPDQVPREIIDGHSHESIPPRYRGGIGSSGVENLNRFVASGGTIVALGSASVFAIDHLQAPVRDLKRYLRRDQHFAPGSVLRLEVETSHPAGYGMARETHGFYLNGPFFAPATDAAAARTTVVAKYPATDVLASGWLLGEELMAGRAAVVSIDMAPGRVVLFGLRPQHRAQTQATFPLLFNALYLSAATPISSPTDQ
jgi:hypothetical protein